MHRGRSRWNGGGQQRRAIQIGNMIPLVVHQQFEAVMEPRDELHPSNRLRYGSECVFKIGNEFGREFQMETYAVLRKNPPTSCRGTSKGAPNDKAISVSLHKLDNK